MSNLLTVIVSTIGVVVAAVVAAAVVAAAVVAAAVVAAGVAGRVVVAGGAGVAGTAGHTTPGKIVGCMEYPTGIVILRAFFHRSSVKLPILPEYTASCPFSDIIHVLFGMGSVR